MTAPREGWHLDRARDLTRVVCDALSGVAGVGHAFSTRLAPDGERLLAATGLGGQPLFGLNQVHGGTVTTGNPVGERSVAADAVARHRDERPRLVAAVRTADCVPLLMAEQGGRAVAAVHAGWRGTARGIAAGAVERLSELGAGAASLIVALGPSIGPCCYAVGPEVAGEVAAACGVDVRQVAEPRGHELYLDLRHANRLQLEAAGVPAGSIHVAPWCTACGADLFFSYRRDGPTGRLLACIGWLGAAP